LRSAVLRATAVLALMLCLAGQAGAYSVLTHEQVVDLVWRDHIRPMLRQRFPNTTEEQLRQAHAYAYGGSLIQDMGYYPFGNKYFSNLVHYVRSGDFVVILLRDARDVNEYAFALGALAHYVSDVWGHPAVNHSVADHFPKLRAKYGPTVTYEDDPKAHIRTEFGFDVVQVSKNRYTSDAYHDFIGFQVAKPLLERAFRETYGIELTDVLKDEDRTIGSYRWAISTIIPKMTKVALVTHRKQIVKEYPTFSKRKFLYYLSRAQYEREWGKNYRRPGFGTRLLAFLLKLVPKVGPFKAAKIIDPTPQTENMYLKSVDDCVEHMDARLREVAAGQLHLENRDFDTGKPTRPGEYKLTDQTYAKLLHKLAQRKFDLLTPALRRNILQFYGDLSANLDTKKRRGDWKELRENLAKLNAASVTQRVAAPTR
jgi:Zinc dependent phospholipase C